MTAYKQQLGAAGEKSAVKFLIKNNYKVLDVNYRCRFGEIDIIARDAQYTVFIEVKTRKNTLYGLPSEAVNYHKQRKILKVAQQYMLYKKRYNDNVRFDVIEVFAQMKEDESVYIQKIRLIKNAFQIV